MTTTLHPLEIREKRFKLQKTLEALEQGAEKAAIEAQIEQIRADCSHEHNEQADDGRWRCRDCDLVREPEPQEPTEVGGAVEAEADPEAAAGA
jgi:hypothetical protein